MFAGKADPDQKSSLVDEQNSQSKSIRIVILGAGLSGSLLYYVLKRKFAGVAGVQILVLESKTELGNLHTWSFHESDVPDSAKSWLQEWPILKWKQQEVVFPEFQRRFDLGYCCLTGENWKNFFEDLQRNSPDDFRFGITVRDLKFESGLQVVTDEQMIQADYVFDARGWNPNPNLQYGYQKFFGKLVELKQAHGLTAPIIMDASVAQIDGYRFVYVLPFDEKTLLVEDTYYSNTADLDLEMLSRNVDEYISDRNWQVQNLLKTEKGSLPLGLFENKILSVSSEKKVRNYFCVGARSELFQPVTGYTMPTNLKIAEAFYHSDLQDWNEVFARLQEEQKSRLEYLRFLNRMLFLVAKPSKRYLILQRFYRMKQDLISRFYSGDLKAQDMLRLLVGKPPVSVFGALRVLFQRQG